MQQKIQTDIKVVSNINEIDISSHLANQRMQKVSPHKPRSDSFIFVDAK